MRQVIESGIIGAVSVGLAVLGALGFQWIGMPLPWMLGPLFLFAVLSFFDLTPFGRTLGLPGKLRVIFVPVVGVMIGARVTPDIISEVARWWPSLLLVVPYMVVVQLLNAEILRRLGGYDRPTAFFAASPGGMVEAVLIGEANGGNGPLMAIQHFARVTLAVSVIPVLLSLELGQPVGSAAGVVASADFRMPDALDILLMSAAGVAGVFLARGLHIPAAIMVGPLILSAIIHATGMTDAQIPDALLKTAQLVIGTTLGSRFAGPSKRDLVRGLGLSVVTLSCTLLIAFGVALLTSALGLADTVVSFIAFAPGGLVEMGLIAISLDADPIFVATHHVMRIGLAVTIAPWIFHWLNRRSRG
ncbi:hypothetical protein BV394_06820 [Brevirhabdus pacifica]|uniref:Uncharacterized protein n=1 Tax=Brevirhabdus pacifica TaxID=1267768 RepID=A0A1U7DHK1_9RHOB|nr:AbrB family transcriptional regulator [Brevirhabdus pacifica]APX89462.1 hypothetical protein BV394_06820 [Brevirhabdus pacifica]PJJ85890.1 hypothetical protein CLV77_0422 [Brevirhabdus pacifica]